MKLRNKKTGEIIDVYKGQILLHYNQGKKTIQFKSIEELEEWEDYEEPKEIWWLDNEGNVNHTTREIDYCFEKNREIGNYFETREEAEKAAEKLKAWKRLKDKGFRFKEWKCTGKIEFTFDNYVDKGDRTESAVDDLDLLFGGEE